MKNILLATVLVMTMAFCASAQCDGFFTSSGDGENYDRSTTLPLLPGGSVGQENEDQSATTPLGSGLLILTALGAGYAIKRVKSRE